MLLLAHPIISEVLNGGDKYYLEQKEKHGEIYGKMVVAVNETSEN